MHLVTKQIQDGSKTRFYFFVKIGDECIACRERVAAFNMSYFAKFLLTGPDSAKAVDWIFTNNMRKPQGRAFFVFRYAINDY